MDERLLNDRTPGIKVDQQGDTVDLEALLKHEDFSEFEAVHEDGSNYATLYDYYYAGLKGFAGMLSMQIPKPYLGTTPAMTEQLSCRAGVLAAGECIAQLRADLAGSERVQIAGTELTNLEGWYADAITDFLTLMLAEVPEKLRKSSDEKTRKAAGRAAIAALEQMQKDLSQ